MKKADEDTFSAKDWLRLIFGVAWLVIFVFHPRLTFAVTSLVIGGAIIAFNAMVFWQRRIGHEGAPSAAPIFGGLIAGAGIAILPIDGAWMWAWIPLLLDWGGLPMFVLWCARRIKTGSW